MKNQILFIILCLGSCILPIDSFGQITRGTQSGELYIPSTWYYQGGQNNFDAIFYTDNYGETLKINYIYNIGSVDMSVGRLISDATEGILYNNINSLWISYDSAETWSFIEDLGTDKRYTSGCLEGEVYKYCKNPTSFLYRSTDYGQIFEEINTGVFGFPEVGTNAGELYILTGSTWPTFDIDLLLSVNFGGNFDSIFIDSIAAGNYISGNLPVISRGVQSGEIFLVSWHFPSNYHIFHSLDYGQSFVLKFISDECDFFFENYYFTAGKESGEFYVVKHIPWFDGINTELYIYYSDDTANTFTEYYHLLDENFPINTYEYEYNTGNPIIKNFPNPFCNETIISISMDIGSKNANVFIYDMLGKKVKEILFLNDNSVTWDGADSDGNQVNGGLYIYNLIIDNKIISSNKLIFIH